MTSDSSLAAPELVGAAHPRVLVHPPLVDVRAGEAAILLAARAGMTLEPWQADGLRVMLARRLDGKWAAFEYGEILARQNGKSATLLACALAGFLILGERTILWSAHEVKTSMRAWRDLRRLLRTLGREVNDNLIEIDGIPIKVSAANGSEGFERLDTGQEIKVVARSKGSGRGFSTDRMIVDEAFAYTEEHQDALMPTLTARPNPQICYASSPPLNGATGGPMYALRKRALRGGDETLAWRDWGIATDLDDVLALPEDERAAFLDRRDLWAASNPALGRGRVTEESILRNRRGLSERGFAREVLGCWPREVDAAQPWPVIGERAWRARATASERPSGPVAFAIAASYPNAGRVALTVAGRLDGQLVVQVIRHDTGTSWVVDEVKRLRDHWGPFAIVADPKGPCDSVVADLEAAGVDLVRPNANDAATAAGVLYAAAAGDAPYLAHFGQADLDHAVATAETRPLGEAWRWRRTEHSAPLEAASLAAWAVVTQTVDAPPNLW